MVGYADTSITLVTPGLLGTLDIGRQFQSLAEQREGMRPLEQWLARAKTLAPGVRGYEPVLLSLFGVENERGGELPAAPLTLYADSGEPPAGYWLRADPVHLQADRDRVLMTGAADRSLDTGCAASLVAELNEFLQPLGFHLSAPTPWRWYLRLPHAPGVRTSPLQAVIGHDVHDHMPRGEDARQWRALLNEIQMLLHGSETNRALQARGLSTVNSLWFWGAGALPPRGTQTWTHVWGGEALLEGLALHHDIPMRALPAGGAAWLSEGAAPGRHLVVCDGLLQPAQKGEYEQWIQGVESFARSWCGPVLQALRKRRISSATLHPAHGAAYEITPGVLKHWWKRRARLYAFLDKQDNLYDPPS